VKECVAKNRPILKHVFVIVFLFLISLLSGCVEEIELNRKVIVVMVGVDRTENDQYKITMGLIDTRLIEEKKPSGVHVYTIEGDTLFEAVRSSIMVLGKQPQWPYIKVIVLGPSFKKNDVVPVLDFFNRNNEIQPNPFITFSHSLAEDIVKLHVDLENIPGVIVEEQILLQDLVAYTPQIQLPEFIEMMLTPDKVGIASIVMSVKENEKMVPKVEGTAVIQEGKWIGDLSNIETRGVLWVREEVLGGIIVIPSIEGKGKIGMEIQDQGKASIKPKLENDQLSVLIDITHDVSISEILDLLDLNDKKVEEIKKITEKQIKEEIEASLKKTREWGTDIYGIGVAVHRKYPKFWRKNEENWSEMFKTLPITINVHVNIKRMGLLRSLPSMN
jgi:spore germination protein KC